MEHSLGLQGVTPLWHVAPWVSRAPPHHTLPAILNLNGRRHSLIIFFLQGFSNQNVEKSSSITGFSGCQSPETGPKPGIRRRAWAQLRLNFYHSYSIINEIILLVLYLILSQIHKELRLLRAQHLLRLFF